MWVVEVIVTQNWWTTQKYVLLVFLRLKRWRQFLFHENGALATASSFLVVERESTSISIQTMLIHNQFNERISILTLQSRIKKYVNMPSAHEPMRSYFPHGSNEIQEKEVLASIPVSCNIDTLAINKLHLPKYCLNLEWLYRLFFFILSSLFF